MTKNEALQAVRGWREQMVESWQGKTSEEIIAELNRSGQPFRDLEASKCFKKEQNISEDGASKLDSA